jgi:hypothetical protein
LCCEDVHTLPQHLANVNTFYNVLDLSTIAYPIK